MKIIKTIYSYKTFIIYAIFFEVVSRYSRSKLGTLWIIINPLSQVLIYSLILTNILSAKLSGIDHQYGYAIYLMSGILGWSLFNEILTRLMNVFIHNANLIKKVNFPRITLIITIIGVSLINNLLIFVCMIIIFILLGHTFNLNILWLVPLTLINIFFATSFGIILGFLNVFIRDLSQAVPILLQLLFWFTPIVYPLSIIPNKYHIFLNFNPFYPIINAYQQIIVYNSIPEVGAISFVLIFIFILCFFGHFVYKKAISEMIDLL